MEITPTDLSTEIVHPDREGFVERVTPKSADGVLFYKCGGCRGCHFRHAGYMQVMLPFMRSGGEKRVNLDDNRVMVCVKCRKCYAWINEQMYDVTDKVDMGAWEATEKELHKTTGPGGQC